MGEHTYMWAVCVCVRKTGDMPSARNNLGRTDREDKWCLESVTHGHVL